MRGPNILVTGTPGTGKTTLSELLAMACGLRHLEVGALVKQQGLHEGYDAEFDTYILDEEKLEQALIPLLQNGSLVIDFHTCDLIPSELVDLVVVLRTNNTILYDRLEERGYSGKKLQENIECEILQVVMDEAQEAFPQEKILERINDQVGDLEQTVEIVKSWLRQALQVGDDSMQI